MTKQFAATYTTQQTRDFLALSNVQAGDWDTLIAAKHRLFGQFTSIWGGHCFDPLWTNNTTNQVYASDSASRGLDETGVAGVAERKLEGSVVRVGVVIFAANTTMEVDLINVETSTTLVSGLSLNAGIEPAYVNASSNIAYSNVTDGSGNPQLIRADITAAQKDGGSGAAEIYQIHGGEFETDTASDLPDGL